MFYDPKLVGFVNNYFCIKFIKVWLTHTPSKPIRILRKSKFIGENKKAQDTKVLLDDCFEEQFSIF